MIRCITENPAAEKGNVDFMMEDGLGVALPTYQKDARLRRVRQLACYTVNFLP